MQTLKQELETILDDYGFNLVLGTDVNIALFPNRYRFSAFDINILCKEDFVTYKVLEFEGVKSLECNISQVEQKKVKAIVGLKEELLEWYIKNGNTFWIEESEE